MKYVLFALATVATLACGADVDADLSVGEQPLEVKVQPTQRLTGEELDLLETRTLHIEPLLVESNPIEFGEGDCSRTVSARYRIAFKGYRGPVTGATTVSCTATCSDPVGGPCSPSGCEPEPDGNCSRDAGCDGDCVPSCSRTVSTTSDLRSALRSTLSAGF